jgi:hypothetical protein
MIRTAPAAPLPSCSVSPPPRLIECPSNHNEHEGHGEAQL